MRFICDKCKAKYSIADEKIKKKVLKIRCKKCSHVIIVRDTTQQASATPLSSVSQAKPSTVSAQRNQNPQASNPFVQQSQAAQQRAAQQRAAQVGPAHHEEQSDVGERTVVARISSDWFNQIRQEKQEEPIWFVASQGQPVGPIVLSDVNNRIRNRELGRDELVWCAGWPDWVPAGTVTELQTAFNMLAAPAPPPPPVRAPQVPPPAPAAPQRAQTQHQPRNGAAAPAGFTNGAQAQQPAASNPFTPQKPVAAPAASNPFAQQKQAAKPAPKPAPKPEPVKPAPAAPAANNPFAQPKQAQGPFGKDPFAHNRTPEPDLGAPKPKFNNPFDTPNTSAPTKPAKGSPLAMLADSSPTPKAGPTKPAATPWDTKGPGAGQALQSNTTPSNRKTPAEVLAAAPAPQPPLSELTSQPAGQPQDAASTPQNDIAHVQQARPAVELVELEAGAEADFFKNAEARKTNDDDELFEVALPPLPNWEREAQEIDADDIIEIEDAIKPRWGMRFLIGGGVIAAIAALILTISWLTGGFEDPVLTAQANTNDNKTNDGPTKVRRRKATKTSNALLGNPLLLTKDNKSKKTKRRYRRPSKRRYRAPSRRKIKMAKSGNASASTSLNQEIYNAYRAKLGGPGARPAARRSVARVIGGGKLPPSLGKRLYNEVVRNQGQVKYCYEQYLKQVYLNGRLTIQIRIEQSGRVSRVKILTRRFRGLKISKCIARKMKRWRFTGFSGTPYIETTVPFLLRAQ